VASLLDRTSDSISTSDSEQPALKRQKSIHTPTEAPSADARAQLEAELQDANMEYDKGKT
jgi:protein-tyrosine phosphatase